MAVRFRGYFLCGFFSNLASLLHKYRADENSSLTLTFAPSFRGTFKGHPSSGWDISSGCTVVIKSLLLPVARSPLSSAKEKSEERLSPIKEEVAPSHPFASAANSHFLSPNDVSFLPRETGFPQRLIALKFSLFRDESVCEL